MDWPIVAHVVSVAYGVLATIVFLFILYIAGLLLIPPRWDEHLGRGPAPAMIGAAVYVVICWFGVEQGMPVAQLAIGYAAVVVVYALVRYRRVAAFLTRTDGIVRRIAVSLGAFAVLYVLAYLFTRPPVNAEFLPVAWAGNLDLANYVLFSKHLLTLGPSNLVGYSYLNYIYLMTPGVFYLLGAFSLLFGSEPMNAAMPIQFALVAAIGMVIAGISTSVFKLSKGASVAIAAVVICGPFFRYIAVNFFLSTLMAMPVLLFLVWATVDGPGRRLFDGSFAIKCASAYLLLLFIYPFLLVVGIGLQIAAIAFMLAAQLQNREQVVTPRDAFLQAGGMLLTATAVFGVIAVCFWSRLVWSIGTIASLSEKGVAGWPLDLISPKAMFGLPGRSHGAIQVASGGQAMAIVIFGGVAAMLLAVHFWWHRRQTTAAQSALAGLLACAIGVYVAYFSRLGPSYQQWKLASYSVLPLSFIAFAMAAQLAHSFGTTGRLARSATDQRLMAALPAFIVAVLIVGNLVAHAAYDPPLRRLPGELRRVAEIDQMPQFREITVRMNESASVLPTYAAIYYLPNKRVHVVSSRFKPSEPLSLELVSRQRPLLMQDFNCEGIGHDDVMTIDGLGCLAFAPPSLKLDVVYPFNRTFLFVGYEGMTAREQGGRWNTRPALPLKLTADPERIRIEGDLHLNLFVNPFLPAGVKPVALVFRVGDERRGEAIVANQEWLSVPIRSTDWTGNRVWTLQPTIDFPDGRTILFHELSLSHRPRGRVVTATGKGDGSRFP